jgi:uncharacterized repeat protein (TIGR01451 family)
VVLSMIRSGPRALGLSLALVCLATLPARGQVSVPTGRQQYIVLGHEQHVYNMMARVATGEALPITGNRMNSVVSLVASADGQILYYDHWEDGFEADPFAPTQPSTLILGDGNPANGDACGWTVGACAGDLITIGMPITLNSNLATGSGSCTTGTQVTCNVPVNPRLASDVRFDGGDSIATSGGPLSLIHNQDPLSPFIGGATEVLPRQAFANATAYSVPAGEDLYLGNGTVTEPFKYVAINLVAFDDNTQVFVNSPGAGTVSIALNRGQHYASCGAVAPCVGAIDGVAAPGITINASTRISTTGPVAGLILTGGDGTYATDFFPILPDLLHGTDYLIPSVGDAAGVNGNRPMNLYLFNPDPLNAITVTAVDSAGTVAINVPANSTVDYFTGIQAATGTGRFVPANSTVRLTSTRPFWGLTVHDHQGASNDWGYSWLSSRFLTQSYTVSYAPGVQDPPSAARCSPAPCNSLNRAPVWVGATQDFTQVKIDFDNDGLFDEVDTDSNDTPDPGAPDPSCNPATPNCLYTINALQALRVYDYTDYDNTGTRIVATAPVAVAYGQDTDQATGPDPIIDTGYTIYPTVQRFLDPVLTVEKAASPSTVPTSGGTVDFTITVQAYDFGPLTSLTVFDRLPAGISSCAAYVAGSTRVTYPDLSQSTADPACAVEPSTGRVRLDWTLTPSTLLQDQQLTIRFSVAIPAGPAAVLQNDVVARALFGSSVFQPTASASVVRTDVTVVKTVTDDGSPEPGEVLTYALVVTNNGVANETGITITDAIPPGTTFVPGSIGSAAPFTGSYSAAQNAVVWTSTGGPLTPGSSVSLGFQVTIDLSTAAGSMVTNAARYRSAQTPVFSSNTVLTTVVGPVLAQVKTGPALLHPNEVATFEVQVTNSGAGRATNLLITDPLAASNTSYVAGTMQWSLNGGPFAALSDAADADPGTATGTTVQLLLATLGPGSDVRFRFQARVAAGTGGQFVNNQASVAAAQLPTSYTNLLQIPIVGDADLTGRVFLDLDGDGTQDPGEPGASGVAVTVTDSTGASQVVFTDANGDFLATVQEGPTGLTTVDVDPTTGSLPAGSTLTTGNDPQTVTVTAGGTTAAPAVGYQPPPIAVAKTSSAGGEVTPGQTVTYTVTITNYTGVTQTGVTVNDPMPPGTTFVPGSLQVALPTFRVTEYDITAGFAGTTFTLNLGQNLAPNYFAIVQGSDGTGADATDRPPSQNYVAVTDDPFGTGDFPGAVAANQLQLTRGAVGSAGGWVGVLTVVECLRDCTTRGFRLLDVQRVVHAGAGVAGVDASAVAWDPARVMLAGGFNGAGCDTAEGNPADTKVCHARLFPSGVNTINWTRNAGGAASLSTATSTVMVVEWGSEWTVHRRRVNGTAGGGGADDAGDYLSSAAFPAVTRANTWVWGTGHTDDNGIGDAAEGVLITLGNGVTQNATETVVSTGIEFAQAMDFEVWALTHPSLSVGYVFKVDGDAGANTVNVAVPYAPSNRMAIGYNGQGGTGSQYPRPMFSARYTNGTTVQLRRRRPGSAFPAWVQGISFSNFLSTATPPACAPGTCPPDLVVAGDGYTLGPGETMVVTFQAVVDNPLAAGITDVTNTATVDTATEAPVQASVTDLVVRPSVTVEPNDAGFAPAGTSITFTHHVTNTAAFADSFLLSVTSQRGWRVDLIDPDTGVALATDLTGDGTWDVGGPTFLTGSLAAGASRTYRLRVTVPGGTPNGVQDTVRLVAASARSAAVSDDARDEITALGTTAPIIVTPDNSGVVVAGSFTAYSHWVINNTGAADTFDLYVASTLGWTTTLHADTNGDGVFTPGVDLVIANTAFLAAGTSQRIFVVTNAPAGTAPGTRDVANITAASRATPGQFGAASDTTTVVVNARHDLSGGGTRLVAPGDTATYPGTLLNLATGADRFELEVSSAALGGFDAFNHPTELWIDTDGDDLADLLIARDDDGDGVWDTVSSDPLYNADGDGFPDVAIGAGATLAYELRRAVDPAQFLERDLVTLTSRSVNDPASDPDSVTATWVFAAVTRASIRGLRVDADRGVVEFATGNQNGTASFQIYETDDPRGETGLVPLHDARVPSPVPDSIRPILYRVETRPVTRPFLVIEETEIDGDRFVKGPFAVGDPKLAANLARLEARMDRLGIAQGPVRVTRLRSAGPRRFRDRPTLRRLRGRPAREGVKIEVEQAGIVMVPAADLAALDFGPVRPGASLRLWNQGRAVHHWLLRDGDAWALAFRAETLATDYTDRSVYILTRGGRPYGMEVALTRSAPSPASGFVRVERNAYYVPGVPAGGDPWVWDFLGDGPWPNPDWDPTAGDFDLPGLLAGGSRTASVRLRVVGYTKHVHTLSAAINGVEVGSVTFEGAVPATLAGPLPVEALQATGNQLTITYTSGDAPGAAAGEGLLVLDSLDVAAPVAPPSATVPAAALEPYDPVLPSWRGVEYLIVTHPQFRAQADRIAAAKAAEGLAAEVVETEDAYDRFSGGIPEARAIQALLRHAARRSGSLRYVLLVGDDTFDPRDFTGGGSASFVPALYARDSVFGLVPSENLYADLDDDGRPELAIGRLPVTTSEEADLLVDKVAGQAAALEPYSGAHLFAADNTTSTDARFREEAEAGTRSVPSTVTVWWADVASGVGRARLDLDAALRSGVAATHYYGHGGFTEWADEGLLTSDDPAARGAAWRPTVVFAWACLTQWHIDVGRSVNEALLFVPGGGAYASFGPAGITAPAGHRTLADKVYAELYRPGITIGEAIRRGKAAAIDGRQSIREVVEGFNLLGDPALRLPRPAAQPE